ncbi:AraC family transcriptional regulator [Paenibacillus psychroresistens]|uniref:AraC family transcriptional regulator n=2 Tax=Paenibacillus psychroresistens TaxID=1778678 RepID=A0A6B8RMD1_9BACL|nr:AraC family transcriptional regulator [Paenibacillus psychroresistens]
MTFTRRSVVEMKMYQSVDFILQDEKIALYKLLNHSNEPEHSHNFIELVYIWRGAGCQQVNGKSYDVQRGDFLFMNVGDRHSFVVQRDMQYMNILFDPDFLNEQLTSTASTHQFLPLKLFQEFQDSLASPVPNVKFRGKSMIELEHLLDIMYMEYCSKKIGYLSMLHGYATLLLTRMFRMMEENLQSSDLRTAYDMLPQLLSYIEQHYAGHITLQDLAKESFYSPNYLSKMFKECLGFTFTEYVHEVRLREAKRLLMETEDSVESIGRSVGYVDKSQFFRMFKQSLGMTPQQHRRQY